jgi:hypothetical protein
LLNNVPKKFHCFHFLPFLENGPLFFHFSQFFQDMFPIFLQFPQKFRLKNPSPAPHRQDTPRIKSAEGDFALLPEFAVAEEDAETRLGLEGRSSPVV